MSTWSSVPRPAPGSDWIPLASRIGGTIVVLVAAVVASMSVALLNAAWFNALDGVVHATGAVARGLLFSSFLLVTGGLIVMWRPSAFGIRMGDIRQNLAFVGGMLALGVLATAAVLRVSGAIPYSDASLFIEAVDVPVTEELVFRSVLLTALLVVLARIWDARTAVGLAILIDGVAFGLAHMANAAAWSTAFVLGQVAFATILGTLCAIVMVRTRSVLPAIALHAVVNGTVVLVS